MPDLDDAKGPKRSREDGDWDVLVVVKSLEAAPRRYNVCSCGNLTSRESVVAEWDCVVEESMGMRPVSCFGFEDGTQ